MLRQFRLGNNLPMHIRENTDFPRQKPWQLPSAAANFEGCILIQASNLMIKRIARKKKSVP